MRKLTITVDFTEGANMENNLNKAINDLAEMIKTKGLIDSWLEGRNADTLDRLYVVEIFTPGADLPVNETEAQNISGIDLRKPQQETDAFRAYILSRIVAVTRQHHTYKERAAEEKDENLSMGLDAMAASLWDCKHELEMTLQHYDNRQFAAAPGPASFIDETTQYTVPPAGWETIDTTPGDLGPEVYELNMEEFAAFPYNHIFASGITSNPILHKTQPVRWVAVAGGNDDWSIYYHLYSRDIEFVRDSGDKCTTESVIRSLVPCTDEVFARYRM